jgi:hypothetical protein
VLRDPFAPEQADAAAVKWALAKGDADPFRLRANDRLARQRNPR